MLKLLSFKVLLLSSLFLLGNGDTYGQFSHSNDSTKHWDFLPDYVKMQFAGGIGFLSMGVGYTFFNQKLEVSYFYGYVPEFVSTDDLHSVSLQLTVKLLRYKVNKNIELVPLNVGWFIHHTFGSEYWIKLPPHYPKEYYWWSPGRNSGIFIGGEIRTKLLANKTPSSGTAFYTRIGTRGLYLASKFGNSSIPITDIIELGFGVAIYR
ncbi:MAG TPA: hypothetical protein VMW01_17190 [Williamwhitmania sp.]|nr:hypothetical protein [Williamwhitmania sp.]